MEMGTPETVTSQVYSSKNETNQLISSYEYATPFLSSSNNNESKVQEEADDASLDIIHPHITRVFQHINAMEIKNIVLELAGQIYPKYCSQLCMKTNEARKSLPVHPDFEQVVITTDAQLNDGYVILTVNRASKIFYAIAEAVFDTSETMMVSRVKLMYLKQLEKDYFAAKKINDRKEMRKCIRLVSNTFAEFDEPWYDDEWLRASKAFFAPFHVLFNCRRVPMNPHVIRYRFSPVIDNEPPIKIVVDNGM